VLAIAQQRFALMQGYLLAAPEYPVAFAIGHIRLAVGSYTNDSRCLDSEIGVVLVGDCVIPKRGNHLLCAKNATRDHRIGIYDSFGRKAG
jgi:hypothetical protein